MADTTTSTYGLTKPEVGASEDTWGEKINTNLDALDNLLSGTATLQGAKLDDTTKIVDNIDATKIVALSAGSLTTATTRTFTFPDATGTFVLADNTATLTNKTLTSPAILTGFTFDGTTVTALSGADTTVVTGTAGTSGNAAVWNADGDVVDGGVAPSAGAMVFIESQDASTSATLDFTGFDATKYDSYVFELQGVLPASVSVDLYVHNSVDGGSTWDNSANMYTWGIAQHGYSASFAAYTPTYVSDDLDTDMQLTQGNIDNADDGVSGTLRVLNAGITKNTVFLFEGIYKVVGGPLTGISSKGRRNAGTVTNGLRFLTGSGNIASGTVTMYGLRNS